MSAVQVLFGEALRNARIAAGLTQHALARRAKVSQAAVSKAEVSLEIGDAGREATLARIVSAIQAEAGSVVTKGAAVDAAATAVGRAFDPSRHNARAVSAVIDALQFRLDLIHAEDLARIADALLSAWTPENSTTERLLLVALARSLREVQP